MLNSYIVTIINFLNFIPLYQWTFMIGRTETYSVLISVHRKIGVQLQNPAGEMLACILETRYDVTSIIIVLG